MMEYEALLKGEMRRNYILVIFYSHYPNHTLGYTLGPAWVVTNLSTNAFSREVVDAEVKVDCCRPSAGVLELPAAFSLPPLI